MAYTLVVGVDGSESSFAALVTAAELAEQSGSRLSVVFVDDPGAAHVLAATYEGTAAPIIEWSLTELEAVSRERTFDLLANRPIEWTFDVTAGEAVHELIGAAILPALRSSSSVGAATACSAASSSGPLHKKLVRSSPISVLVVSHPAVDSARRAAQREPYGEQRLRRQQRPFVHQRDDEECKRPRDCAPDRDEQQPVKESGKLDERVGEPVVEIAADNRQDRGDDEHREVRDEAEGVDGAARTRVVGAGRKEHHASAPVSFRR